MESNYRIHKHFRAVMEKFLGDLNFNCGYFDEALVHYTRAHIIYNDIVSGEVGEYGERVFLDSRAERKNLQSVISEIKSKKSGERISHGPDP